MIAQSPLVEARPGMIQMTPGVKMASKEGSGDTLGQQYVSPEEAIMKRGADVIIVGRGITSDLDPAEAARRYQQQGWQAYQDGISQI